MRQGYLLELAEIQKSAQRHVLGNKFRYFGDVYSALHLLDYMRSKNIDTGMLFDAFAELRLLFDQQENATELLKRISDEINRLKGDSWSMYQEKMIA